MNTRDAFVIFWNLEHGQEESQGLYVYGLFPSGVLREYNNAMHAVVDRIRGACQVSEIESEFGTVGIIALKLESLPDESVWQQVLNDVFSILLGSGASVAWAGGEDCSWSPEVLNPQSGGGGNIYAAKSARTGLLCNGKLDEPLAFLIDSQLSGLWNVVQRTT